MKIRYMKGLIYIFLCFVAVKTSAQNISGLYSGTLINDSLKMVQNYELALSEYRGKITGYSYITFVSNDTFYYGIKRIKATRKNGELVVEDVDMLANNYPKRPDKGVHVINRIPLPPGEDTILDMNGRWETTGTKKFYSISGALNLRKDNDSTQSPLIAHLKELKVINYQDEKKEKNNIARTEVQQKPKALKKGAKEIALNGTKSPETSPQAVAGKEPAATEIIAKRKTSPKSNPSENSSKELAQSETKVNNIESTTTTVKQSNENVVQDTKPKHVIVSEAKATQAVVTGARTAQNKPSLTQAATTEIKTKGVSAAEQPKSTVTSVTADKSKPKEVASKETVTIAQSKNAEPNIALTSTATEVKPAVATAFEPAKTIIDLSPVVKRATNTIQTVNVVSDSLVLTFYDNGVVDGDSISVYLNDQNIVSKVKLTEAAVKKTVFTPNTNADEMRLTLVAENLGTIPPNTGLLIIQDGGQRYQIRFSADMQTNASVIIKKKK